MKAEGRLRQREGRRDKLREGRKVMRWTLGTFFFEAVETLGKEAKVSHNAQVK